jgi:hypothetical protein
VPGEGTNVLIILSLWVRNRVMSRPIAVQNSLKEHAYLSVGFYGIIPLFSYKKIVTIVARIWDPHAIDTGSTTKIFAWQHVRAPCL